MAKKLFDYYTDHYKFEYGKTNSNIPNIKDKNFFPSQNFNYLKILIWHMARF
jgi:hypothetical protein